MKRTSVAASRQSAVNGGNGKKFELFEPSLPFARNLKAPIVERKFIPLFGRKF